MNMDVTDKQRDILRHALGFGRRTRPGWRNHFVTGPGSDPCADLRRAIVRAAAWMALPVLSQGGLKNE